LIRLGFVFRQLLGGTIIASPPRILTQVIAEGFGNKQKEMPMKKLLLMTAFMSLAGMTTVKADQVTPNEKEIVVAINEAYVPAGFDMNSDVYVVASGIFPNGCYRWNRADVANPSPTVHEIKAVATVKQGMCLMVLVPFSKEVRLGKFSTGEHTLKFMNGDGTWLEKKVVIE
jgi:hypothetical protein